MEPQPLLIQSHLGSYAITTVGKINNEKELIQEAFKKGHIHFMEMSGGKINATELVGAIISQADSLVEGLKLAQEKIKGSMTILLLTPEGIYISRDRLGRTPRSSDAKMVRSVFPLKALHTSTLDTRTTKNWDRARSSA